MCGIVGYLGKKAPVPLIIESLRHLEYRGYDSAGVAYLGDDHNLHVYKSSGKLINLEKTLPSQLTERSENGALHVGIGHIRWAAHGLPNDINAHPHLSPKNEIAIVHNGIIENFFELRRELETAGQKFASQTDTECVVQLLEVLSRDEADFAQVIQKMLTKIRGAYALGVISKSNPDKLYAVRNQAPLVVGIGNGEYMLASDAVALAQHNIDKIIYLHDREIAEISPAGVKIWTTEGKPVTPHIESLVMGPLQIDKKGFKHFMLKEIFEQPDVVRNSLASRLISPQQPVQLFSREEDKKKAAGVLKLLTSAKRLIVIGCGTSFNAGLVGKYFIEELVRIPVEVESAGEFRYRSAVIDKNTLVVTVSQSGETADTLAALRQAKEHGASVVAVTNREDSTIARESDLVLHVRAGVEVSVCATKSFTAQVLVLYLLGMAMAEERGSYHPEQMEFLKTEFFKIPTRIEAVLSNTEPIHNLAKKYGNAKNVLFIARGINYPVALEGALKLKEISYIHAEGYSGSELKHGPIAMLDNAIPVISLLVPGVVFDKMISNCQEAKARDAQVVAFTSVPLNEDVSTTFDDIVEIPEVPELLSPLINTVPFQLLAYYIAEHLGKDVDQPRNLAKSVTVE